MWRKQKHHRRASDQIRSLTRGGILDEQAFWQIVRAEKERADRSGLPVTVAVFTVKEDAKEYSALAGWNAASLCQLLRDTARITDHVGVAGANELGVVLWGTRELGSYRFVNRLGDSAQGLAARCNLFVYPELKPSADSPEGGVSDKGCRHSSRSNSVPQGILNRIAEVESQLAKAVAVETPADSSLDTDDFDETYSFGFSENTTELLEQIEENPDGTNQSAFHDIEDDDDDLRPPTGGQVYESVPVTSESCQGSSSEGSAGVALMQSPPQKAKTTSQAALDQAVSSETRQASGKIDADFAVQLEPLENLFLHPFPRWKRAVDIVGAGCGLVVLSPLLCALACLIKVTSTGPVFFRQLREGYGGKLFQINKFRTMRVGADAEKAQLQAQSEQDGPAFKMENDPRITGLGNFLRKTCLDELPQLWNVLLGDMTLVGPRPLDHRESSKIARWGRRRLNVMPGLTCIWQVHGKSKVTFNEWMRMDIRYSQRVSFRQDMKLVFATVKQMVLRQASH